MRFTSNRSPGQYANRQEAGRLLANALQPLVAGVPRRDVLILGLARGGVAVAAEVAAMLGSSLDACVVRKIGSPIQPELAIGAVAPGGVRVYNRGLIAGIGLSGQTVEGLTAAVEVERNLLDDQLRAGRPLPELRGKTVILVDDGLATGATMRAALEYARPAAGSTVIAVPVGSPDVIRSFEDLGVGVVALIAPRNFRSVGLWYDRFEEVTSEVVIALLEEDSGASFIE